MVQQRIDNGDSGDFFQNMTDTGDGLAPTVIQSPPAVNTTNTEGRVTVGTSTTQILAANPSRKGGYIQNVGSASVFVSLGGTATNQLTEIQADGSLSLIIDGVNVWTGSIDGIVDAATEDVVVVEV